MLSQPSQHPQAKLFGLDLSVFWSDLKSAWRAMAQWRVLSWLWPDLPVRVILPSGGMALISDLSSVAVRDDIRAPSARFAALVLAEDVLLRRELILPELGPAELEAALVLEAQSLSPFTQEDLAWTYETGPRDHGSLGVGLILCSRKLVARELASAHPDLRVREPEIWVARQYGPGFVMLNGFGEGHRQRQRAAWRWVSVLLALLALALLAAIAITPSVKLHLLSKQASQAMSDLQRKAGPVISQREKLVHAGEQLAALAVLVGRPLPPLKTLQLITEALPDDTSLFNIQVQGLKVSITGQTGNAAALMKQLGSTPGLRDVKAPTAATKPLGAPRESFTIEFTLDPAQLKPAS